MLKLYRAERVNSFDKAMRDKYGLSSYALIHSAASLAFDIIREKVKNRRSLILVGSGNNGSDGIALYLLMCTEGLNVKVFYANEAKSSENQSLRSYVFSSDVVDKIEGYDVYIDAVFGAAFHPPINEKMKTLFDKVNGMNAYRIALDVPSAYYFNADLTISFTMLKEEMFSSFSHFGHLELRNPGFDKNEIESYKEDSFLLEDGDYSVPPFDERDYKNKRGHLLIKSGSDDYKGAAILNAKAAFHTGAGLVTLFTESLKDAAYYYPPLIVKSGDLDFDKYDALLAGSGWADDKDRSFIYFPKNMVLDADALTLINKGDDFKKRAVITPHLGEARRLSERLGIDDNAKEIAKCLNCIVVKKSSTVEITDGENTYYYHGVNPSLGVAGSGDVLSGIIGALLSSGLKPLDAAINGVILHQRAGKKAHAQYGYYDTLNLIDEIGRLR